jgi:rSAM/selenodomain-associated transferase 2
MTPQQPEISIIIPVLNEASELPGLLDHLEEQRGIRFEVILCDGGSDDESLRIIYERAGQQSYGIATIYAPRGRGSQMNAAAGLAGSGLLLFLHVDSRFSHPEALRTAVSAFDLEADKTDGIMAARFGLRFHRQTTRPSLAYTYYEAKARLNRWDCIRGDQGFMIRRSDFDRTGRYSTAQPFLEDVRFAEAVAKNGRWILLPVDLITSARRFEQEGLYERQVINAIIANAVSIGWDGFFSDLNGLYRNSSEGGRLQLVPFLAAIRLLLSEKPALWRRTFWQATGRYVAGNAWQMFFWLDVRRSFSAGRGAGDVQPVYLALYLKSLDRLSRTRCAGFLAQLIVRVWLRLILFKETSRTV